MRSAAHPAPRRSPSDGGYLRGEETRRRIVEAALEVFAEEGFARASTRRIAAAAGVNPPALQYYFDSKEGLHRACADRIVADVAARLEPVLASGARAAERGDADEALDALCELAEVVADLTLTSDAAPVWRRFIARAQQDDEGGAYPRIKSAIGEPMRALALALTAQAIRVSPEEEVVRLRALLILSQLSSFHNNREQAMQAMGWNRLDAGRARLLRATVREHTRAIVLAARRPSSAAPETGRPA